MAYVPKEQKAIIVAAVKAVIPKGWKVSFAVRHYSTIVMTVQSAPLNLLESFHLTTWENENFHTDINTHNPESKCKSQEMRDILRKLVDALNTGNYDNSDIMTDYFDVGHYTSLQFGTHAKGFKDSRI